MIKSRIFYNTTLNIFLASNSDIVNFVEYKKNL